MLPTRPALAQLHYLLPLALLACSHSAPPAQGVPTETAAPVPESQVQSHDLNAEQSTEMLAPVAKNGAKDYSGVVKIVPSLWKS